MAKKKSETKNSPVGQAKLQKVNVETRMIHHPNLWVAVKRKTPLAGSNGPWECYPVDGWHTRTYIYENAYIETIIQAVIVFDGYVVPHRDLVHSLNYDACDAEVITEDKFHDAHFLETHPGIPGKLDS